MCKFEFALQEVRKISQSNEILVERGWSDGSDYSAKLTWPARTHAGAWDDRYDEPCKHKGM